MPNKAAAADEEVGGVDRDLVSLVAAIEKKTRAELKRVKAEEEKAKAEERRADAQERQLEFEEKRFKALEKLQSSVDELVGLNRKVLDGIPLKTRMNEQTRMLELVLQIQQLLVPVLVEVVGDSAHAERLSQLVKAIGCHGVRVGGINVDAGKDAHVEAGRDVVAGGE